MLINKFRRLKGEREKWGRRAVEENPKVRIYKVPFFTFMFVVLRAVRGKLCLGWAFTRQIGRKGHTEVFFTFLSIVIFITFYFNVC